MQLHLFPTMSLSFMFITIILVHAPTSLLANNDEQYLSCNASFDCGNIQGIGYPFWGSNRPAYCGHPNSTFQLNCSGQNPVITILQFPYKVLRIDNAAQSLTVARTDYTQTICPTFLHNTTLDTNLFAYTLDTQPITLYHGCPNFAMPILIAPNSSFTTQYFNCTVNRTEMSGYYITRSPSSLDGNITIFLESCNNSVTVPATQSAVQSLESSPTDENLIRAFDQGFGLQWRANNGWCNTCQFSGGKCGNDQNTGRFTCYCPDGPYQLSCAESPGNNSTTGFWKTNWRLIFAIAIPATVAIFIIVIYFTEGSKATRSLWSKNTKHNEKIEVFLANYHSHIAKRYSYSDIKKMTNSFINKLGQGGFGGVYKGQLPDGRLVAVKVLNKSKADGEDFINEVASISRTSHINIVTLLGFCYGRTKRALIYEYMPNGSLDKFIYNQGSPHTNHHLEWKALYEIAIGIARGLEYLHRGCNTRIVHFDIKPHNILLDERFCPKISDFGLAKLCEREKSKFSMTGARGTAGYIAPEVFCRNFGGVSYKSDVYSYGMMVLEIVGGRKTIDVGVSHTSEIYFPDWIYKHLESGDQVSKLHGDILEEEEEMVKKMILVGLWCIQTNPLDRPSMTKVVEMLEGSLQSLQIPPKPFLSAPTRSAQEQSSTVSSPTHASSQMEEQKILSM